MPEHEQRAFLEKTSILRIPSFSMPIGLLDLSAFLIEKIPEINIGILDIGKDLYEHYLNKMSPITLESYLESELRKVKFVPDVVGISLLFATSHKTSLIIAKIVKEKWPDCLLVFGGNQATNTYKMLLRNPFIDYVICGEGELSFTELIAKIINKEKDINVFGVFDKQKALNSEYELSPLIINLDEIPFPSIDLLDVDFYKSAIGGSLLFSRGCAFHCAFCASHTVHGRRIRYKSYERILNEFNRLVEIYRFDKIIIEDDLFAAKKDQFLRLAEEFSKKSGLTYFLPQGLSVAILDEDIIDAMAKMGQKEATVAIESASQYVQEKIIKKNVSLPKAKKILEYLRTKGFLIYVNFIFGFPGESKEMMKETIDFIGTIDVDWIYIFNFLPLPGSELFRKLVADKIIDPETFNYDGLRLGRRVYDSPEISAEELENLVYDTNIERNFFNNDNLLKKRYERAIAIFKLYVTEPYPFHIVGKYVQSLAYRGMGRISDAEVELKECLEWIRKNPESKRLYERYKEKMPLLTSLMESQSPSSC